MVPETHQRSTACMAGIIKIRLHQRHPHCPSQRSIKPPSGLDGRSDQWVHAFAGPAAGRQAGGTAHRGAVFYPPFYGRLLFVAWTTTTTTAKQSKAKEKVRGWCMFPPLFSCAMTAPMDGEEQTRAEPPSARCVCAPAHTQDLEIVCMCDGAAVKGHGERRGEARPRCEGGPDQAEVRVC